MQAKSDEEDFQELTRKDIRLVLYIGEGRRGKKIKSSTYRDETPDT